MDHPGDLQRLTGWQLLQCKDGHCCLFEGHDACTPQACYMKRFISCVLKQVSAVPCQANVVVLGLGTVVLLQTRALVAAQPVSVKIHWQVMQQLLPIMKICLLLLLDWHA